MEEAKEYGKAYKPKKQNNTGKLMSEFRRP